MFELNKNLEIKKEIFEGTVIFTIDDFYENPKEVENYLFGEPSEIPLHKRHEKPSFNGVYFEDRRHDPVDSLDLKKVYDFLSNLCGQDYGSSDIVTNCSRFKKHEFNDYKNCVWCPHTDGGYNGIVYFNDDSEHGTTLYLPTEDEDEIDYYYSGSPEHSAPWRKREKYKAIKTLEPKYNRFVFFDGYEFDHGMNICTDRYFGEEYRKNQVFFFDNPVFLKELEEEEDDYDD